jgi:hypothetical protein
MLHNAVRFPKTDQSGNRKRRQPLFPGKSIVQDENWENAMPRPNEQLQCESISISEIVEVISLRNQAGLTCQLLKSANGWSLARIIHELRR